MNKEQDIFKPFGTWCQDRKVEPVFEMANVAPEDHRFGVALKMHILQPGDKWPGHGPRVKFFKKNQEREYFSISLHPDSANIRLVAGKPDGIATEREVNILIRKVQHYRVPLWNMYHDNDMSHAELLAEMRQIDAGKEVPVRGGRYNMDKRMR